MKTVQEWLYAVDEDRLIRTYFSVQSIDFTDPDLIKFPLTELIAKAEKTIQAFIAHLKSIAAIKSDHMIFLAHWNAGYGNTDIQPLLLDLNDLRAGRTEHYGWSMTDREEVMGYLIADTSLAHENIYELLSEILYETSAWGYSESKFQEERAKLQESLKQAEMQIKEGKTFGLDSMLEQLGITRDPEHVRLHRAVVTAKCELDHYCISRDIDELKSILQIKESTNENDSAGKTE